MQHELHIQVVSFVKSCVSKHNQLQSSELKWSPIPHGKWYHNGKILSNWSPTVVMWSNLLNFWHPVWFFNGPISFSGSFVIPCWQLKRFSSSTSIFPFLNLSASGSGLVYLHQHRIPWLSNQIFKLRYLEAAYLQILRIISWNPLT